MQGEFRLAGSIGEFVSQLKLPREAEHKLLLWQSVGGSKRNKVEGVFCSIKKEKDRVIIIIELDQTSSFNQKESIFILDDEFGLLFKGQYEFCVNKKLQLVVDDKVFLREKRKQDRYNFHYTKVNVSLVYQDSVPIDNATVRNLNEAGASIIVKDTIGNKLKVGSDISLTKIHGITLPRQIDGTIAHITSSKNVRGLEGSFLVIGVKFNQKSKLLLKVFQSM